MQTYLKPKWYAILFEKWKLKMLLYTHAKHTHTETQREREKEEDRKVVNHVNILMLANCFSLALVGILHGKTKRTRTHNLPMMKPHTPTAATQIHFRSNFKFYLKTIKCHIYFGISQCCLTSECVYVCLLSEYLNVPLHAFCRKFIGNREK